MRETVETMYRGNKNLGTCEVTNPPCAPLRLRGFYELYELVLLACSILLSLIRLFGSESELRQWVSCMISMGKKRQCGRIYYSRFLGNLGSFSGSFGEMPGYGTYMGRV